MTIRTSRIARLLLVVLLTFVLASTLPAAPQALANEASNSEYFDKTGHYVTNAFLDYFYARGGLEMFGYPRTEAFIENGRLVQYFQRARMEWWPENPQPFKVQLALLGDLMLGPGDPAVPNQIPGGASQGNGIRYYKETGHHVFGAFLTYFDRYGGLDMFGYPTSEQYPEGGIVVQRFQRARFEYNARNPDPFKVQLTLLGDIYVFQTAQFSKALTGPVPGTPTKPRILEPIQTASTYYVSMAERMYNIEFAVSKINGTVINPGQSFNFNRIIGPQTLAAGWKLGYAISGNETVASAAGGICQVATTLFQSVFWAGYQVDDRTSHFYRIRKYEAGPTGMVGLDAAVDEGAPNLIWTNNGPGPVTVKMWVDSGYVYARLIGQKPGWQVNVEGPFISNIVKADPTRVETYDATLAAGRVIQVESAEDGMTVRVTRTVIQNGQQVSRYNVNSFYRPARNVFAIGTKR